MTVPPGSSPVPRGAETPFLSGRMATDRRGCQDSVAGKGGIPVWSGRQRGGRVSETAMMAPLSLIGIIFFASVCPVDTPPALEQPMEASYPWRPTISLPTFP